jgi:hypothetical protein
MTHSKNNTKLKSQHAHGIHLLLYDATHNEILLPLNHHHPLPLINDNSNIIDDSPHPASQPVVIITTTTQPNIRKRIKTSILNAEQIYTTKLKANNH